jgi:thiol-disulfide isomerase/thioredoxin
MRTRKVLIGIVVLVLVQASAIALYLVVKRSRAVEPAPFAVETLQPRPAPELAFERADGSRATLQSMRGKVVMVHFWATWCPPCRDELPGLLALADELASNQPFELVAVSVDDDWEKMRRFFSGTVHRAAVRPERADVHRQFGASTLPDTYLVDASGQIVQRYTGARDWRTQAARDHLTTSIAAARRN